TKLTIYHQKDGEYIKRGDIVGLPGVPTYIPSDNEIVHFNAAKDPFYQIKVKDERTGNVFLSSVKMCQMVGSEWHDEITLHLDENNHFYYLSYYPESNYCVSSKSDITTQPFNTTVNVVTPVTGPKPLLGNFMSKQSPPKTKKATVSINDEIPENKEIEEKTFFQKYWYMIIGGAFLLMSMVATEPPPAGAPPARS
ncbi:hypothetical protein INT47_001122, partial [Mucor saturninus]